MFRRCLVLGIMTAALFVSSALLWSMKAPPMVGGVSALGAAGYIVGAYLGRHLLRTIRKTGDIDFKAGPLQGDKEHG